MEFYFLLLLIGLMAFALGSGYPVAFALPGSAIITIVIAALSGYFVAGDADAYFAQGSAVNWLTAGVTNFRGIYWEVERDTLIAIPLFIFMGVMLQRSKIAEDLLVTMAQLFGPIPGGLGISVVFVGALLAATTGIVGATVVAMGLISLPAMLQRGYSPALASGTICASGTLGQIIPPSIVLIILADQLASAVDQAGTARKALHKAATGELQMPSEYGVQSTSAGDMFMGAFVPGLMLVGIYMLFILLFAFLRPRYAPAVHYDGEYDRAFYGRVLLTLIPPLALIILVLGSIIGGIATVNQAGAIGAVGAMIMAGYRLKEGRSAFIPALLAIASMILIAYAVSNYDTNIKGLDNAEDEFGVLLALIGVGGMVLSILWSGWRTYRIDDTLRGVMIDTAKTTSLVFIILLGAAMLTSAFRAFGGEELVKEYLESLPGGFWAKFVIVMVVIFVLGFFLDFIEIAVVVVPIVAPILLADPSANITAVWLGVMIGLNIQTSFLTPPFGFALFYLRGVAPPSVKTTQIYKGVVAFICLQLIALGIVGLYPSLVNYLPKRLSLTAESAPPPLNPALQYCMEDYVSEQFAADGGQIKSAVERMATVDISYLPSKLGKELGESFENAANSFALMGAIESAAAEVEANSPDYKPLHRSVRAIEAKILAIDEETEELETFARRAEDSSAAKKKAEDHIVELAAERAELEASIPDDWQGRYETFNKLTIAEADARNKYRRNADNAYEPLVDTIEIIEDRANLEEFGTVLSSLQATIDAADPSEREEIAKQAERAAGDVEGTREIKSLLTKAKRALRDRKPEPEKAAGFIAEAEAAYADDLAWRTKAESELLPQLLTYRDAIADTIGLRGQERLPREQALYVASCSSGHRDISLNF
jgi:tripartite ATP-independent transporter DctM subunit